MKRPSSFFSNTGGHFNRQPLPPSPQWQLAYDDLYENLSQYPRTLEHRTDWFKFHAANPRVYQLICQGAESLLRADPDTESSIDLIWVDLRHNRHVTTTDPFFALRNVRRAWYARLWVVEHPQYPRFIKLVPLRSKGYRVDHLGNVI